MLVCGGLGGWVWEVNFVGQMIDLLRWVNGGGVNLVSFTKVLASGSGLMKLTLC